MNSGVNNDAHGTYAPSCQTRFKTAMLKLSLCDHRSVSILVKRTVAITGAGSDKDIRNADARNKQVTFKNWESFTN